MSITVLDSELDRLRAVVEASRLVFSTLDLDPLLDNVLRAAASIVGAERGTFYVCDAAAGELWSRVLTGHLTRVEIRLPYGQGMAGHTAQTGETLLIDDVSDSPLFDPETDRRTGFRTRNAVCVPIRDRDGDVVAVMQLLNKTGGFSAEDVEFITLMALPISQALANARAQQLAIERQRMERELDVASEIQTALLPRSLAAPPGTTMAAWTVPSRSIGGDYYDVIRLPGGSTLVVVADVSGKGVPAALVISNVQGALWATAGQDLTLEQRGTQINDLLWQRLGGQRYVTAVLLLLSPDGRTIRYLNAGHPPALLRGASSVVRLYATATPLGLLPDQDFPAASIELQPGDALLVYSDGITEATDGTGEELGVDGLERLLIASDAIGAEAVLASVRAEVERFADPDHDRDDRTMLVLAV